MTQIDPTSADIIAALRLAKERAINAENYADLGVFRDAEKSAMIMARERVSVGERIAQEIEAQLPHTNWVDPNGRPRSCPQEWPGGPCTCIRGQAAAIARGVTL